MNSSLHTDEFLDVVNLKNEIIGTASKKEIHNNKSLIHREVGVLLVDSANQILFQKRSSNKTTYPGMWVVSAGGHIERGETPLLAAQRELLEEIGIEVPIYFLTMELNYETSETHFIYWYVAKYNNESLTLDTNEVDEVKFFSQDELNSIMNINDGDFDWVNAKGFRNSFSMKAFRITKRFWEREFDEIVDAQENITSEAICLIDKQDNLVGKVDRVKTNQNPRLFHREVATIIYDEKNKILFQKRSKSKEKNPGVWTISSAGHVDFGESELESAIRELYEETGIKTELREIRKNWIQKDMETQLSTLFIGKCPKNANIKCEEGEVDELKFLNREELGKLIARGERVGKGSEKLAEEFWEGKL